jgi:hypothetical protein
MMHFRMQERDLDLFILEELHSNSGFDCWLGERIGLKGFTCDKAEHSISAKLNAKWGETDVLAFFAKSPETVAVLIEDKIAADFQETQAERYQGRAIGLVNEGKATRALTVLVAPAVYLANVPIEDPWDQRVSLELLQEWFRDRDGAHNLWRAAALKECLARVQRTKTAGNEDVRRFSVAFAAFLKERYADRFSHTLTGDKWGFTVASPHTPAHVGLAWKTGKSSVDLAFSSFNIDKALGFEPPPGVSKRITPGELQPPSGVIFGVDVPLADLTAPFSEQADVVNAVMAAIETLMPIVPRVLKA